MHACYRTTVDASNKKPNEVNNARQHPASFNEFQKSQNVTLSDTIVQHSKSSTQNNETLCTLSNTSLHEQPNVNFNIDKSGIYQPCMSHLSDRNITNNNNTPSTLNVNLSISVGKSNQPSLANTTYLSPQGINFGINNPYLCPSKDFMGVSPSPIDLNQSISPNSAMVTSTNGLYSQNDKILRGIATKDKVTTASCTSTTNLSERKHHRRISDKMPYKPSYVSADERCRVCGAPATGMHYKAMTCEGCKGFFRRTNHKNLKDTYKCKFLKNCIISKNVKKMCQYCRYQKCLLVNMREDVVMTPEERELKRQKIIDNKMKREIERCNRLSAGPVSSIISGNNLPMTDGLSNNNNVATKSSQSLRQQFKSVTSFQNTNNNTILNSTTNNNKSRVTDLSKNYFGNKQGDKISLSNNRYIVSNINGQKETFSFADNHNLMNQSPKTLVDSLKHQEHCLSYASQKKPKTCIPLVFPSHRTANDLEKFLDNVIIEADKLVVAYNNAISCTSEILNMDQISLLNDVTQSQIKAILKNNLQNDKLYDDLFSSIHASNLELLRYFVGISEFLSLNVALQKWLLERSSFEYNYLRTVRNFDATESSLILSEHVKITRDMYFNKMLNSKPMTAYLIAQTLNDISFDTREWVVYLTMSLFCFNRIYPRTAENNNYYKLYQKASKHFIHMFQVLFLSKYSLTGHLYHAANYVYVPKPSDTKYTPGLAIGLAINRMEWLSTVFEIIFDIQEACSRTFDYNFPDGTVTKKNNNDDIPIIFIAIVYQLMNNLPHQVSPFENSLRENKDNDHTFIDSVMSFDGDNDIDKSGFETTPSSNDQQKSVESLECSMKTPSLILGVPSGSVNSSGCYAETATLTPLNLAINDESSPDEKPNDD